MTIETPGAVLQYLRTGHGPPILLIQGVGAVGNAWRPQIDGLADRFSLISFDNRGIGGSQIRDGRLMIDDMAADALAIINAEGIDGVHVAGHSMGGVIAQAVALAAPERVRSLAFLCTFARGQDGARMSLSMLLTAIRMRVGTRPMRRNAFLELIMPARYLETIDRAALAARLHPLFGRDLADQPPIIMKQLRAMAAYDASSRLSQLAHIPTLVVAATEDRIARPEYGRAIAAAVPGAKYVEIADAGHGVPIHRADDINALLAEHVLAAESRYSTSSCRPPTIPARTL
jgi:pimeloyl-ACP methyl ester carboxylesterase